MNTSEDLPCLMEQVAEFTESLTESHPTDLREIDAKLSLVVVEATNIIYV